MLYTQLFDQLFRLADSTPEYNGALPVHVRLDVYKRQAIMVLDNTWANKPTEMWVSKRDLTNDEELPGATLAIKDTDGNTVTTWVSTDEPHRVTGLHFGEAYTLTEIRAADGYALANDITFRLIQKSDEDGNHLEECEVYYLTTKIILFWKWDDWKLLDDATVIMRDDITTVSYTHLDVYKRQVYLLDCHIQLKLLLVFIHKL